MAHKTHRRTQAACFSDAQYGDVAITWIGHASFLVQFSDLNVLIDPNFANWLFLLKRLRRAGCRISDLPPIDLVLLTHAHFDHFHKPTLRKIPTPKLGVMPWGVGDLAHDLGFGRVLELANLGKLFARGLESDAHPLQALGSPDDP